MSAQFITVEAALEIVSGEPHLAKTLECQW